MLHVHVHIHVHKRMPRGSGRGNAGGVDHGVRDGGVPQLRHFRDALVAFENELRIEHFHHGRAGLHKHNVHQLRSMDGEQHAYPGHVTHLALKRDTVEGQQFRLNPLVLQGGREVVHVENAATVLAIHQRDDSPPLSVRNGVALVGRCSHHVHFIHGQKTVLHIRHNGQENLARIGINTSYNVLEHDAVGITMNQVGGKKR